jgi:peptide/nickel transport system substrate-binding protein
LLNVNTAVLRDKRVRRALSSAIDRRRFVVEGLAGHGTPADGPVWPDHLAYDPTAGTIAYDPRPVASGDSTITVHCLFGADPSRERAALALRKQLLEVGVNLELESLPPSQVVKEWQSGNFEAILSDFVHGPNLVRPYWFWHTGGPFNYGHYSNAAVDAALDSIRHATADVDYRKGVSDFQREIAGDPPAIFLAWGERIRAVSNRFQLPEAGGEVWGPYLRLWRPAGDAAVTAPH